LLLAVDHSFLHDLGWLDVACSKTVVVETRAPMGAMFWAMDDAMTRARPMYAWYVVAVLMLANVSAFVDRQILGVLVTPIKRDFGISDAEMSYLSAAFSLFFAVMGLPIARLAGRIGRRNVMATGVALWSVFTILCATARTYARLFVMRIGVGVGEASLNAPSVSLIADYFPRERLGRAMSVYQLGIFVGSGVGYFLGGWISQITRVEEAWRVPVIGVIRPWQSAFLVAGLPGLFIALLVLTIREPAGATADVRGEGSFRARLRFVARHRRTFLTHAFGFSFFAMVNFGLAFWIPTFFQRTYGWDPASASRVQGLLTMTLGVFGVLAGGWVTDAFVRRGLGDGPLRAGILGATGMLVCATAFPLMPTPALAVATLAILNIFAASPWGAASAALAAVSPAPLRAQAAALFFMVLSVLGGMGGPIAVAQLTDRVFGADHVRYSIAVVSALGMTISVSLLVAGLSAYRATLRAANG
jgi:MFS family permease